MKTILSKITLEKRGDLVKDDIISRGSGKSDEIDGGGLKTPDFR